MSKLIEVFSRLASNNQKRPQQTPLPNCWEFYQCPEERHRNCSAFTENAGRTCWQIAGTLCRGRVRSIQAMKIGGCQKCDFYIQVRTKQV